MGHQWTELGLAPGLATDSNRIVGIRSGRSDQLPNLSCGPEPCGTHRVPVYWKEANGMIRGQSRISKVSSTQMSRVMERSFLK